MNRRALFEWLARGVGSLCAAAVAVPAVRYMIHPLRRSSSAPQGFKRVLRFEVLQAGLPKRVDLRGTRIDAWTVYPEEIIGRVWLVRKTDGTAAPEESQVTAFTSVCPHLGCTVQHAPEAKQFVCPCHKAGFDESGEPIPEQDLGHQNPAPRAMDSLPCQVVQDEKTGTWWVEVEYLKFRYGPTTKIVEA